MRRYLYIPLLFALITTVTSFGFIATVLVSQLGKESYISPDQLYAVVAISVAATTFSFGLLTLIVFELLKKNILPSENQIISKAVIVFGLVFCGLAIWSFFLVPTDFYEDFLLKFTHSARFEFLMIGVSAKP